MIMEISEIFRSVNIVQLLEQGEGKPIVPGAVKSAPEDAAGPPFHPGEQACKFIWPNIPVEADQVVAAVAGRPHYQVMGLQAGKCVCQQRRVNGWTVRPDQDRPQCSPGQGGVEGLGHSLAQAASLLFMQ